MEKFKNAKWGDKVYCLLNGEGVISEIHLEVEYPIFVRFLNNQIMSYNFKGFDLSTNLNPTLYWSKPEIIEQPKYEEVEIEGYWWVNHFWTKRIDGQSSFLQASLKGEQAKLIIKRKIN